MAKLKKDPVEDAKGARSAAGSNAVGSALWGLLLFLWCVFALLGLISYRWTDISRNCSGTGAVGMNWFGTVGAVHSYWLYMTFGFGAWVLVLVAFFISFFLIFRRMYRLRFLYAAIVVVTVCPFLQLCAPAFHEWMSADGLNISPNSGGALGMLLCDLCVRPWLGTWGTAAAFCIPLAGALVMFVGPSNIAALFSRRDERLYEPEPGRLRRSFAAAGAFIARLKPSGMLKRSEGEADIPLPQANVHGQRQDADAPRGVLAPAEPPPERISAARRHAAKPVPEQSAAANRHVPREQVSEPSLQRDAPRADGDGGSFVLPPTSLLDPVKRGDDGVDEEEIKEKSRIIEDTLRQFNIDAEVTNVVSGPVITRYELRPPQGVRVDKVSTYANDIQMALRAKSMRMLCPIPGLNAMGIEVPNKNRRVVSMREVAESREWAAATEKMALPMLLGVDLSGEPMLADLAKMPHMLVAGTTGSGKSVCLNAILGGLLMCRTPERLRFVMVDPKLVEFTQYQGLPHLSAPIITNVKCAVAALNWAIAEMNKRLKLFRRVNVRNIVAFNSRMTQTTMFGEGDDEDDTIPKTLPYIVVVIDEMADLMMDGRADVEQRIIKLAQLSRASGIHMIIATQRPSVDVITGMIKANFPARIAFKVVQSVDSRTILDTPGAERLIGMGDMLFSNPTNGTISRAQGVWISDKEVDAIVNWLTNQAEPEYDPDMQDRLNKVKTDDDGDSGGDSGEEDSSDEDEETQLMRKALEAFAGGGNVSTSFLQRRLRIGYNRAARIIDALEEKGCISAQTASGRELLRTTLENSFVDADADLEDTSGEV